MEVLLGATEETSAALHTCLRLIDLKLYVFSTVTVTVVQMD